jgi:hypothetical protein
VAIARYRRVDSIGNCKSVIANRNPYQAPEAVQSRGCEPRQAGNGATVADLGCAAVYPEPDQFSHYSDRNLQVGQSQNWQSQIGNQFGQIGNRKIGNHEIGNRKFTR